jgi:hypothetical protein
VGFALLASLGLFTHEGVPQKALAGTLEVSEGKALHARREPLVCAPAISPASFVSANFAPLKPGVPLAAGGSPAAAFESIVHPRACSRVDRQGILVTALILKKYLHFRESLTSP